MKQSTILLARPLPEALMPALESFGRVQLREENQTSTGDILVTTAVDPVPASLIEQLPSSLRLIANLGVGVDNIDLTAATKRGIAVSNTPVVAEDTADLTMALMLATLRRLNVCERHLRAQDWASGNRQLGTRIHGKKLGIVGFGDIGQAIARRAKGFDLSIAYHGPNRKTGAESATGAVYYPRLTDLLADVDILSLNCPLNAQTRHLLNASTLQLLKPGAVIINTGRGPLIDEQALVVALQSGRLGGAGLDVFEFEPEVTPALLEFDNVTLLPHIGSATSECRTDMVRRLCANIAQFLQHGSPLDRCN